MNQQNSARFSQSEEFCPAPGPSQPVLLRLPGQLSFGKLRFTEDVSLDVAVKSIADHPPGT